MKYIMMITAALLLNGCQGSSDKEQVNVDKETVSSSVVDGAVVVPLQNSKNVTMEIGKVYTVNKGDRLNKTSDDAVVTITQKTQEEAKEVVLVSGSAEIVYK